MLKTRSTAWLMKTERKVRLFIGPIFLHYLFVLPCNSTYCL